MPKGQYDRLSADAQAERAQEVRRLAFEEGLDRTQIAAKLGTITPSGVGLILDTGGDRQRILNYLEHQSSGIGIRELSAALSMDINKAQYVVDTLRKRGFITADESKSSVETGDHRSYTNIKLKKRQHGKVVRTNGHHGQEAAKPSSFVTDRIPKRLVPALAEAVASVALDHDPKMETQSVPEEPVPVVAEVVSSDILHVEDIPRYPILVRLLDRDAKIQEAARLLEKVGLDNIALQALAETDKFTPLEREYMKHARQNSDREEE